MAKLRRLSVVSLSSSLSDASTWQDNPAMLRPLLPLLQMYFKIWEILHVQVDEGERRAGGIK